MFVRTKDGVYENVNPYFIKDNKVYMSWDYPTGIEADFLGDILNQSENLEELCDCFVIEWLPSNYKDIFGVDKYSKEVIKSCIGNNKTNVYGAIWTDKGLIYVAKMNENGDLELI